MSWFNQGAELPCIHQGPKDAGGSPIAVHSLISQFSKTSSHVFSRLGPRPVGLFCDFFSLLLENIHQDVLSGRVLRKMPIGANVMPGCNLGVIFNYKATSAAQLV